MKEEPPFEVVLVVVPVGSGASEEAVAVVAVDALGVHQEAVVVVERVVEGNWNSRSSVVQALVASPSAVALDCRLY